MKTYLAKAAAGAKSVALDDMILTTALPTTAGSKMLDGYCSLFDATVVEKLQSAGYSVAGKLNVGEFGFDVIGESSYYGAVRNADGSYASAAALALDEGGIDAVVTVDINGAPRRSAAQSGKVFIKPTYGTVSRYGTVAVACSGETVGVMADCADSAKTVLGAIAGYDCKDGTMHAQSKIDAALRDAKPRKIAVLTGFDTDAEGQQKIEAFKAACEGAGITVEQADGTLLKSASTAWNILMCAELCNNVSRFDGIKYGYRSKDYTTIDELYTNSRTEAFGDELKAAILYGSDVLSTKNYMPVYDKALRVRRVMVEALNKLFEQYDAVVLPACSKMKYADIDVAPYAVYTENLYTAPASISGLPAVVCAGVQAVGKAFSDGMLLELAKTAEEGK
ncbi:MAG: hypothetical protein IKT81_03575 [Clostridia bacterium]|nr:hypothetical protein [Clostridia bacterium]